MKRILSLTILIIFTVISSVFSQENKSRFGVEAGVIPWYYDTFSRQMPFTISVFTGVSYEHFFSNSISLKTTVGIQNINYKTSYLGKERKWHTNLELKVEPRYYLWKEQQKWGNLFASLPVSIDLGPFQNNSYGNILKTQTIKALGAVGYQYYFARHWYVEANAGLGWSMDRYPEQSFHDFDYLLEAKIGFSF